MTVALQKRQQNCSLLIIKTLTFRKTTFYFLTLSSGFKVLSLHFIFKLIQYNTHFPSDPTEITMKWFPHTSGYMPFRFHLIFTILSCLKEVWIQVKRTRFRLQCIREQHKPAKKAWKNKNKSAAKMCSTPNMCWFTLAEMVNSLSNQQSVNQCGRALIGGKTFHIQPRVERNLSIMSKDRAGWS